MKPLKTAIVLLLTIPAIAISNQNVIFNMSKKNALPPYTFGQKVDSIDNPQLVEISGMAPSSRYTDCFWVHNDSGDQANIYLINLAGDLIATLSLPISNRDWEAITIADGYIYIGEVGDNMAIYNDKRIYKVAEPTTIDLTKRAQQLTSNKYETMAFNFANGQRDCETMMYDPISKELVLVSKREESVFVYTTPFIATPKDKTILISHCATLDFRNVTAGDITLAGDKILIKNYEDIFFWERDTKQTIAQALSAEKTKLAYNPEPQGESIAWSTHEDAFYTISEKNGNIAPIIYKYERTRK
ncbi:MAG: hypothetical protein SNH94_01490 [Rikenellaceae bacterium]